MILFLKNKTENLKDKNRRAKQTDKTKDLLWGGVFLYAKKQYNTLSYV